MTATAIDLKLPAGLRFVGEWKAPAAKASSAPDTTVYEGDVLFTRDVLVTVKAGALTVGGTLRFQACDHERCLPPQAEPVTLRMRISER
jgi:DsbC/DsbD-like thiol-disulfide interchange protein